MRVADYIFKKLADWGIEHVFLVTGGGAMFLNDGLRCEKRITPVCCHNEQGCAIAAEGYFRASKKIGVVSVTSGPGGTNTLTGLIGQWLDSIPAIYISGQVKFETTIKSCPELGLRQLGDQEFNITDVIKKITKYSAFVSDPKSIGKELEAAYYHAINGRPGPVWLDIPLDVQGALIDENELPTFEVPFSDITRVQPEQLAKLNSLIKKAKRPVLIAGWGIRLADAEAEFAEFLDKIDIPVVSTFNGFDLIPTDHPRFSGRIGTFGQRAGNFVLQNADLVLSVGTRNNVRQISYNWKSYCRNAVKISVDIDAAELKKKTFVPDLPINANAKDFFASFNLDCPNNLPDWSSWRTWCTECLVKNPAHTQTHIMWDDGINPYHFMHELTSLMPDDTDLVAGNGTACVVLFQTGIVKAGQRIFWNSGCASMGYDVPAALGACMATGRKTVCLSGDGSFMMNLQELQVIAFHKLPCKLFLLDNNGYCSIKQTQKNFFGNELLGCDPQSGIGFPDFLMIARAFGIENLYEVSEQKNLKKVIDEVLNSDGPAFCLVRMPDNLNFEPKLSSQRLPDGTIVSSPIEDMFPFMERNEFKSNMIQE